MTEKAHTDQLLLVWERAIVTQMHFAELSIKTRQIGMTVVGATLGLAVVLQKEGTSYILTFCGLLFPIATILCWSAALVLFAIGLLDVGVYHRMLRGAVAFNEELEQEHLLEVFGTEKGLTQAISFFSRHPDAKYSFESRDKKGKKYFRTSEKSLHFAGNRIILFYAIMIAALVAAGVAVMSAGVQ